jgi:hypothetical protein
MKSRPPLDDDALPEPPQVRALRRLVTTLTVALILGVSTVAGAMVLRITRAEPSATFDPRAVGAERLAVPAGETVTATGAAPGTIILATRDAEGRERLRLYDADTGAALREIAIGR